MFVYIFCTPGAQKWSVACVIWDDVSLDADTDAQIVSCRNETPRSNLWSHYFINVFFPSIRFDHSPLWSSFKTKRRSRRVRHEACHAAGACGSLYSEVKWVHTIKSGKLGATTLLYWFVFSVKPVKPDCYGPDLSVFTPSLAVNLRPWLFTKQPLGGVKRPLPSIAEPISSPFFAPRSKLFFLQRWQMFSLTLTALYFKISRFALHFDRIRIGFSHFK